ncbi:MAG TPA: hypothetical protein VFP71_02185 [Candidatus Angelobacter sp.]|nr:hypothetical protein [Candidatus Angelobacter sp.]
MLKLEDNRVLVRAGARQLTIEEIDYVNGGAGPLQTHVCSAPFVTATHTGPGDGDGCGDSDFAANPL